MNRHMNEAACQWVLNHSTATMPHRVTLLAMAFRSDAENVSAFDDWEELAQLARVNTRTAKRHIQKLMNGGHVFQIAPLAWRINTQK
jgi:hypothetical protein